MFNRKVGIIFSLLLVLVATGVSFSGYASRITTWSSGQTLNASNLNAEFDNVLDNGVGVTTTQTLLNKTLSSPIFNTAVSGTAFLDEDDMSSDSATKLASQQSVKAYVDNSTKIFQNSTGSLFVIAGTIPFDNSIPQNTEGGEVVTQSITPQSTTSKLLIEAQVVATNSALSDTSAALFQDSISSALVASGEEGDVGDLSIITLSYLMDAGTTSPITFKLRAGSSTGSLYINGVGSISPIYGGASNTFIRVTEYVQ
jgi:hypothetical protein